MRDSQWMYVTPKQLLYLKRLRDEARRLDVKLSRTYDSRPGHVITKAEASKLITTMSSEINAHMERVARTMKDIPAEDIINTIVSFYSEGLPIVNSMWGAQMEYPDVEDIGGIWSELTNQAISRLRVSGMYDIRRSSVVGQYEISRAFPDACGAELDDLYARYKIRRAVVQ